MSDRLSVAMALLFVSVAGLMALIRMFFPELSWFWVLVPLGAPILIFVGTLTVLAVLTLVVFLTGIFDRRL
jgi:hypothetical protein